MAWLRKLMRGNISTADCGLSTAFMSAAISQGNTIEAIDESPQPFCTHEGLPQQKPSGARLAADPDN
jgi:hypothetical protein